MPQIFSSVLGKKKPSEGSVLPGKVVGKDKGSAAGGAGSLPVASPPDQDGNSSDIILDSKPKKGIIFEICSEDGFHIRCESIEGERKQLHVFFFYKPLAKGHTMFFFSFLLRLCCWTEWFAVLSLVHTSVSSHKKKKSSFFKCVDYILITALTKDFLTAFDVTEIKD